MYYSGLTVSAYLRSLALGHKSRYRMTEKELEAINTFTDAVCDLRQVLRLLRKWGSHML